jgi:hypothetical protein
LTPLATPVESRPDWNPLRADESGQQTDTYSGRISIGCEPREATLARLRARLLRMIVENERVRHERRILPR